jgi:hypothetical protein
MLLNEMRGITKIYPLLKHGLIKPLDVQELLTNLVTTPVLKKCATSQQAPLKK